VEEQEWAENKNTEERGGEKLDDNIKMRMKRR
jgi:hypothetical protein